MRTTQQDISALDTLTLTIGSALSGCSHGYRRSPEAYQAVETEETEETTEGDHDAVVLSAESWAADDKGQELCNTFMAAWG